MELEMKVNSRKADLLFSDPDYACYSSAMRFIEQREFKEDQTRDQEKIEKLKKIFEQQFDIELAYRQQQIEQIEEQIWKTQKLLHLLRYVVVNTYYNNSEAVESQEVTSSTSSTPSIWDGQQRIHPAIKKLLGKKTNLEFLSSRKRSSRARMHIDSLLGEADIKKIKIENIDGNQINFDTQSEDFLGHSKISSRKKLKHRIVVGNISKWMPSLENDNLTHKWMIYVRGPKECPDVSNIIRKIIFHLHPSYKPHDMVEVSETPFHLARRGWGEFPVRVQIFFKNSLNKPVDIVHNLKLDKTYSGRQTLGNETVIDLFLHEADEFTTNVHIKDEFPEQDYLSEDYDAFDQEKLEKQIKRELEENKSELDIDIEGFCDDPISTFTTKSEFNTLEFDDDVCANTEHDYCTESVKPQINPDTLSHSISEYIYYDHSYSLPYSCRDFPKKSVSIGNEDLQKQDTNLIHGLEDYFNLQTNEKYTCNKNKELLLSNISTLKPIYLFPPSFQKILNTGNIISITFKPQANNLEKSESKSLLDGKINYEHFKLYVPKNTFKNVGEVLPYLFKRLPLYTHLASNLSYKCLYPFTAISEKEYSTWHPAKRFGAEWNRAKSIRRILITEGIFGCNEWNTKAILMYGRSHSYTPHATYNMFKKDSRELKLINTCLSNCVPLRNAQISEEHTDHNSIDIEIDPSVLPSKMPSCEKVCIDISDKSFTSHCSYVRQAALDCGIVLRPEELEEGIMFNGAERMILEAVKCLAEGLIRRGRHQLVATTNFDLNRSEINVGNVETVLNERLDMESIRAFQRTKRLKEFFL